MHLFYSRQMKQTIFQLKALRLLVAAPTFSVEALQL